MEDHHHAEITMLMVSTICIAGLHNDVEVKWGNLDCNVFVEGIFITAAIDRLLPMWQTSSRHFTHQASFNSQKISFTNGSVFTAVLLLKRVVLRDAKDLLRVILPPKTMCQTTATFLEILTFKCSG